MAARLFASKPEDTASQEK
jgi:glutamyl/glutaminyl-tRNA synthetase